MHFLSRHFRVIFAVCGFLAAGAGAHAAARVDCAAIMSTPRNDTMKIDPNDVQACMIRGWDPPQHWLPKEGKGSGARTGGANGFSYGAVQAPERPPGQQRANASVSGATIKASCIFPLRIGLPPRLPSGSCMDFLNDLFSDKNGKKHSTLPPGGGGGAIPGTNQADTCLAESDTTGFYGVKSSIAAGGAIAAPCGGVVPTTATDLVLNSNPTHLAIVSGNVLSVYARSGTEFTLKRRAALPTYLCMENPTAPNKGLLQNTVDLTPATDQIITYTATQGSLVLRLHSRETMDMGFLPPYDAQQPEKQLVLPLDTQGLPEIPANCAKETDYYKVSAARQDVRILASNESGCESASYSATRRNNGQCDALGCHNDWVWVCQPAEPLFTPVPGNPPPAAPPQCPAANPLTGTVAGGSPGAIPSTCASAAETLPTPDANCDLITLQPAGASCTGKTQYGVLNRPGLYYPSGSTATFYKISGLTSLLAETGADTRLFMQSNTTIYLQPTAPQLMLEEGGTLVFDNGTILQMNPSAVIRAGAGSVQLNGGGQMLSADGALLQSFEVNASVPLPAASSEKPHELHVGRSMTLPPGLLIPTTPQVGTQPPYIRLPVDTPPP